MINKKLKNKVYANLALSLFLAPQVLSINQVVYANNYSYKPKEECVIDEKSNNSGSISSNLNASDVGGEWSTPGTEKYKIAEALFKVLTEDYGLSGTSAAGWLGNVQAESDFTLRITEAENGQNYSGRGYGLFQFTPGEKYKNSQFYKEGTSLEEEVKNQVAFIFASEFNNGAYKSYLSNSADWFGLSGVDSLDDILDNNDPETAMLIFFATYERGDVAQMHRDRRKSAALTANKLFNKDNIKADKTKWPSGSEGTTGISINIDQDSKTQEDDCEDGSSSKSVGGGAWGESGTGTHSFTHTQSFRRENLPDELKKYAVEPESIGMKFGSSEGWNLLADDGGQCTDLVASFSFALWGLKQAQGDGMAVVSYWEQNHGTAGKISEPTNGAVVSIPPTATNAYGHTGIVSHVFENGDILLLEQNGTGLSGTYGGMLHTWHYSINKKSDTSSWTFYDPGKVPGAKKNEAIRTME